LKPLVVKRRRIVKEGHFVVGLYGITEEAFASCIPEGDKLTIPFYALWADRPYIVVADAFAYRPLVVFMLVGCSAVLEDGGGQR
jgi:hypothetical protein